MYLSAVIVVCLSVYLKYFFGNLFICLLIFKTFWREFLRFRRRPTLEPRKGFNSGRPVQEN